MEERTLVALSDTYVWEVQRNMEPLIRTFDDWQTAPASAIRSWMAENVTVTVSEYRRNANDLQRDLGPAVANAFAAAIAPTMPLAIQSLGLDAGLNFADPHTIATLEALASTYPQFSSVVSTILGWVRTTKTRWAWSYDDEPLPTEQQIASSRAAMLVAEWCERAIDKLSALSRNGKSIEELKAEIAELT